MHFLIVIYHAGCQSSGVMKKLFAISLLASLPAFAGTPTQVASEPAPQSDIWTWFAGGSVGYLTNLEEAMYTGHVGVDTPWKLAGFDIALFGEIGYTQKDESWSSVSRTSSTSGNVNPFPGGSNSIGNAEDYLGNKTTRLQGPTSYELDILPITANIKFERAITGNLNAYFGAGLGAAYVDFSAHAPIGNFSQTDWVFAGQVFAGVTYNVNQHFEIFSGARWIYLDDLDVSGKGVGGKKYSGSVDIGDDFLFELGARYNF